ncbi:hypothetical protein PRIPAC_89634 [Pristionchus pacificus]|uniref:Store-operated calcium entry-associated regulatory factor n=1 Tax=Pristionchus pacificus TaxID=54126 RepID=A0A2A6CWT9_PRIPA|nr:hypothetical protein PRIPAC_89634 [Pristionchus pacificus]|eukprot:PDM82546.1 hypothetical protein PRIPAC_36939 [Pristionchus pacificus]
MGHVSPLTHHSCPHSTSNRFFQMIRWIFFIAALLVGLAECADRVLLKDVTAITLTEGARTNGLLISLEFQCRRSSSVPQLTCIGGSAHGKVQEPRIVQCKNVGFDGADVQWECKAELDSRVKFGRISVSCEGYNHPDDPFVLRGSCGLEYELDWKSASERGESKGSSSSTTGESVITFLSIAFIACVVIYMIYNAMSGDPAAPDPPGFRRFGTGFDNGPGGPPGGGGGHPGYPGSGPPPRPNCNSYETKKYDDAFGKGTYSSSAGARRGNDGPGFWTGAGLGALGGYFMGRQQNEGARFRGFNHGSSGFNSAPTYDDGPSTSSRSSQPSRSTATGYGGTTRR